MTTTKILATLGATALLAACSSDAYDVREGPQAVHPAPPAIQHFDPACHSHGGKGCHTHAGDGAHPIVD